MQRGTPMVWQVNSRGEKVFAGGMENWELAAETARRCSGFRPDDEDEQVSDDPISCYDCRYRRWDVDTFLCMKDRCEGS